MPRFPFQPLHVGRSVIIGHTLRSSSHWKNDTWKTDPYLLARPGNHWPIRQNWQRNVPSNWKMAERANSWDVQLREGIPHRFQRNLCRWKQQMTIGTKYRRPVHSIWRDQRLLTARSSQSTLIWNLAREPSLSAISQWGTRKLWPQARTSSACTLLKQHLTGECRESLAFRVIRTKISTFQTFLFSFRVHGKKRNRNVNQHWSGCMTCHLADVAQFWIVS
jgi:hypothetical protein